MSHVHTDILFSTEVEEGIDVLLSQFMEEDIDGKIFYSDTSSELGNKDSGDFEEQFITECVDVFQEVDKGFDIHINKLNYQLLTNLKNTKIIQKAIIEKKLLVRPWLV